MSLPDASSGAAGSGAAFAPAAFSGPAAPDDPEELDDAWADDAASLRPLTLPASSRVPGQADAAQQDVLAELFTDVEVAAQVLRRYGVAPELLVERVRSARAAQGTAGGGAGAAGGCPQRPG